MSTEFSWVEQLTQDVNFGYLKRQTNAPKQHNPQVVLNNSGGSVLRTLREELRRSDIFTFSVAFVSPRAIALLKQELVDFEGSGHVITSDYLNFNSPAAFAELLNLRQLGLDVRIHRAAAFHPKGYVFEHPHAITAMMGSSNLTENALVNNHEWNLKVSAAPDSDLAAQLSSLVEQQLVDSEPLTKAWIDDYAENYLAPAPRRSRPSPNDFQDHIVANQMQRDALLAIDLVRASGEQRAIIVSATGTGKTILSALDVREFAPNRLLFVVHREQILDRTIREYQRVLGGPPSDFGKLAGSARQTTARYLFATVQSLSKPESLAQFAPDHFDYVILDEAHRAGAESHKRVLAHFAPKFLLGMTATPERTDGFNVYELFDYNVPYEIRLNHALEEQMLCPFHYYGVTDITYADGTTTTEEADLHVLISPARVDHLLRAIEIYGQAGVLPRGLIFCSRRDEARDLASAMNSRTLRGRTLRTVALTGEDSVAFREQKVAELERGELDYILTVDVFNEGLDIPSVNQVIMLRQTKSAIVFVQQLGRGLRKAPDKEYLVVIDFIGNYSNNYLIPIALFGDESLNKESLRKSLIAAEEIGVLPGLSSVRFDRIAQERVLSSIREATLDSLGELKRAIVAMRNRVGCAPQLWDFLRFESVDPVVLATKRENYPSLIQSTLKVDSGLDVRENRALHLVSHEVLPAKRLHELILLELLLREGSATNELVMRAFAAAGVPATMNHVNSAIDTLTLENHSQADLNRYHDGVALRRSANRVELNAGLVTAYRENPRFASAVDDVLRTGKKLIEDRYRADVPFTPGRQYSRRDVTRLLCWPRKWTSTIYGYRADLPTAMCPIFVTLHKSDGITATTAYEDKIDDRSTLTWYTRSRRTLDSDEVRLIVEGRVDLHIFVKKDDAEGSDFYYLGEATSHDAEQTTMPNEGDKRIDVVRMRLRLRDPIDVALYDYFHPVVTLA